MTDSTNITIAIDDNDPYGVVNGAATRWITKDSVCLLISSMSDRHIINTINMLERKLKRVHDNAEAAWSFYADCRGDMASYYGGHMAEEASLRSAMYSWAAQPILAGLRAEARRRNLHEVLRS